MKNINKSLLFLLEADPNKTWVNPKTGNHVGYGRALQLGLIKPHEITNQPSVATTTDKVSTRGHATGPRPKKDPNAPKAWWSHLTKHKLNAYPVGIPEDQVQMNFTGDIDSHWVMKWKSLKTGKMTGAYTKKFLDKNAEIKWKRILKIKPKDIQHIHDAADKILGSPTADDKLKQAAAIIGIIAHTGLRIGSLKGFGETGNRGTSTLSPENITISGNSIKFEFMGKSYQENKAEIFHPTLSKYLLRKKLEKRDSPFLFDIPKNYIDRVYDKHMKMEKFKIKDLRTYIANKVTRELLYDDPASPPPLPIDPKEIKNVVKEKLKGIFEKVAGILNNTPGMARTSYIHPQIIHNWLGSIGVKAEFVGYKESTIIKESTSKIEIGKEAYDGVYFTANDPGVIKHIRDDGWVILNYKVSGGVGVAIPPDRLTLVNEFSESFIKEDEFDAMIAAGDIDSDDEFEDVDVYNLPIWWDSSEWQLIPIK